MFEYEGTDPVDQSKKIGKAFAQARYEAEKRGIKPFLFHASTTDEFDARTEMREISGALDEIADKYLPEISDGRAKLAKSLRKEFERTASVRLAAKEELASSLKETLGNVFDMYFRVHASHWNVNGPDFHEYHALFGEIADDIYGSVDPLAENLLKLGVAAPSSLAEIQDASSLKYSATKSASEMVEELIDLNTQVIASLNKTFDAANSAKEQGIANFIADRLDHHQKWQWQLSASAGKKVSKIEKVAQGVAPHPIVGPSNPIQTQTLGVAEGQGIQLQNSPQTPSPGGSPNGALGANIQLQNSPQTPQAGGSPLGALGGNIQLQNSAQTPQNGSPLGALGQNIQTQTKGASVLPQWIDDAIEKESAIQQFPPLTGVSKGGIDFDCHGCDTCDRCIMGYDRDGNEAPCTCDPSTCRCKCSKPGTLSHVKRGSLEDVPTEALEAWAQKLREEQE